MFTFFSLLFSKKGKIKCPKKEEDVTILIPAYNASKTIVETLASIKRQKYNGNIFVKIIDDGSTDETLEILKSQNLDENYEIIELQHLGKAFALN